MNIPSHQNGAFMDPATSPSADDLRYGAPFGSGVSMLPRSSQQPQQQQQSVYATHQMSGGFSPRGGADQFAPMSASAGGYMADNGSAWAYNGGVVATVNGALNGPGRQRAVNRRSQLPPVRTTAPLSYGPRSYYDLNPYPAGSQLGLQSFPLDDFSTCGYFPTATTTPVDFPTTTPGDFPATTPVEFPTTAPVDVPTTTPGDFPTTPGDFPTPVHVPTPVDFLTRDDSRPLNNGYNGYNGYSGYSGYNATASFEHLLRLRQSTNMYQQQTWTDAASVMPSFSPSFPPAMGNAMAGLPSDRRHQGLSGDEQLIPTAIVIKNIPFAVRKETLADIMVQMRLPTPYAFNYHFDHGVFRGLAFANFSTAEDTRIVIESMDGLEVANRKLRVEYKKMLPEAERERIEREKRERRGQLEEQHRGPMLHSQTSMQSLASISASQAPSRPPTMRAYSNAPASAPWADAPPQQQQQQQQQQQRPVEDLDLNDAQTLDFYTKLMLFKSDESREIFIFPASIAPPQRRTIHVLAQNLGLVHESVGQGDSRQVHVMKVSRSSQMGRASSNNNAAMPSMEAGRSRGLNRAATFDFADQNSRAVSHNHGYGLNRHGPTLEVPGSPDTPSIPTGLRAAKSFTDLRSFSPTTSSQSSSTYIAGATPAGNGAMGGGNNGMGIIGASTPTSAGFGGYGPVSPASSSAVTPNLTSTGSVNDLYGQFGGLNLSADAGAVRSNPGTIGSQRPGQASRTVPERQPRGPNQEATSSFRRISGHATHGSGDSSDNAARGPSQPRF